MKKRVSIALAGLIALTASGLFSGCGSAGAMSRHFDAQGSIQSTEISINSKLPGRIKTVFVSEGEKVSAGDKLVEIASDEIVAKKEQAEAAVSQAKAALELANGQVAQAEAGVEASESQLEQAKAALDASKALVNQAQAGVSSARALISQAKSSVTASEGKVREAAAGRDAALKQQEAAEAVQTKANNGAREQEIAQAQAAYDLLKTTYDRVSELEKSGAVSKQKLDEVATQLAVAELNLSMAHEGARAEDKAAAAATNDQAKAGITASQTRIDQAEAGLSAARAQLTQAMAGEQAAQAQLTQAMAGEQAAQAQLSQAEAGVSAAKAAFAQAKSGVLARQAQVEQAQAAVREVESYLRDTVVCAPGDGTVSAFNCSEGELVSSGTSIGSISKMEKPWLLLNVKETDIGRIAEDDTVTITLPAYPDKEFSGKIVTINKEPDFAVKRATNQNGDFDIVSFGVKIVIDDTEQKLYAGMTAMVTF